MVKGGGGHVRIGGRTVGPGHPPLVIAELGINHEGDVAKALRMVDDAASAGAECVKLQTHVVEDEMVPNRVVPGNAEESIWEIMSRCALSAEDEIVVKRRAEERGLIFLSTPFSRAAADRLFGLGIEAFKIGSGECNNEPLVRHVAAFGRPVLLSTGMNDMASVRRTVEILRDAGVAFAVLHCTSVYPTPHEQVRLGALQELAEAFPDAVIGLSDHSLGNWTCFAAVALGASIVEKHFTSDRAWPGPDVPISIDPPQLRDLIEGCRAIHRALGGSKTVLPQEAPTIAFAYASVVSTRPIARGETLGPDNVWVKRPGTGEIRARDYDAVLGRVAARDLPAEALLSWDDLEGGR